MSNNFVKFIAEICHNLQSGKVTLTKCAAKKLSKYSVHMRNMTERGRSLKRRRAVVQSGGFLATLIAAVAPVLIELVAKKLMEKSGNNN